MKTVKLGDVCQIVNGGTPKTGVAEYWDGDILWITPKDLGKIKDRETAHTSRQLSQAGIDNSSAKVIPAHSVILSTRAPIGHVVINTKPMAFNQGCRGLIPGDCIIAEYLYYFLKLSKKYLNELGTGTTFRELSTGALKGVDLPLPSLDEQKKIVERLDAAFERISAAEVLMRRNLDNVAALQKSILHKYLSASDTTHTYRLGDICMFRPKKSEIKTKLDGKELVSFAPMEMLPINQKYFSAVEEKPLEKVYSSYTYFQEADVIYAKITPCFENGKLSIAKGLKNGVGFGSSEFVPIRCSEKILPDYLYYFLLQPGFIQNGIPVMHGASGHRRVPNEYTENLEIGLPSLEEQRRIVAKLDAILSDSRELESQYTKKLTKLTELRQSLLQEAFSTTK